MADWYHTLNWVARGMEYADNFIDDDGRRGVFVKALVENEDWAAVELERHIEALPKTPAEIARDAG